MVSGAAPMTLPTYRKLTEIKKMHRAAFKQAIAALSDEELDQFAHQPTAGSMRDPSHHADLEQELIRRSE